MTTTTTPHPTIPGVTVIYLSSRRRVLRFEATEVVAHVGIDAVWLRSNDPDAIGTSFHLVHIEHAETVMAMIRDQVTWSEEQGATS